MSRFLQLCDDKKEGTRLDVLFRNQIQESYIFEFDYSRDNITLFYDTMKKDGAVALTDVTSTTIVFDDNKIDRMKFRKVFPGEMEDFIAKAREMNRHRR